MHLSPSKTPTPPERYLPFSDTRSVIIILCALSKSASLYGSSSKSRLYASMAFFTSLISLGAPNTRFPSNISVTCSIERELFSIAKDDWIVFILLCFLNIGVGILPILADRCPTVSAIMMVRLDISSVISKGGTYPVYSFSFMTHPPPILSLSCLYACLRGHCGRFPS